MRLQVITASVVALAAALVSAQPVLLTADTNVIPGATMLNGVPLTSADITVRGCTLTITGTHSIRSLRIEDIGGVPGVVTHAPGGTGGANPIGLRLTVTQNVFIAPVAGGLPNRIDVSGKGFAGSEGTGQGIDSVSDSAGGGHAGAGGNTAAGLEGAGGGSTYGSFTSPLTFGSGGGAPGGGPSGAAGGGAVSLSVNGSVGIDGAIFANGEGLVSGAGGWRGGGGAGGSIFITTPSLSGGGIISANGGSRACCGAGGGGGGRIAITATSSFNGIIQAAGGEGAQDGGAGTIYTPLNGGTPVLRIDNAGHDQPAFTEMTGSVTVTGNLIVAGNAVVGPAELDTSLVLTVTGTATINPDSQIAAHGRGFLPGQGQGAGPASPTDSAGGGHAGAGGDNDLGHEGGDTYGFIRQPVAMGSGGGLSGGGTIGGSPGGGVVRLIVNGLLTNNGVIGSDSINGLNGSGGFRSGGGAGGSVWVTCNSLGGSGAFTAFGGSRTCCGAGGGGGGRIALDFTTSTFTGTYSARGGEGHIDGGAGTVFLNPASGADTLILDNADHDNPATTEMTGSVAPISDLIVRNGAILGPDHQDESLSLNLQSVTVEADGTIGASFRGHPAGTGPGAGSPSLSDAAGGAHAGAGGDAMSGTLTGGGTYGDIVAPVTMGSGGGLPGGGSLGGGAGGGTFALLCSGTLTVNGTIASDGQIGLNGSGAWRGGGGAGGSVRITCTSLFGSGVIRANGGPRICCSAGGGGGGRIAVVFGTDAFTGSISAFGGDGEKDGGAGTIYLNATTATDTLIIDNNNHDNAEYTEMSGFVSLNANAVIRNRGVIGPAEEDASLNLVVAGDVTIAPLSAIAADFRGYSGGSGPAPGSPSNIDSPGGGHGGNGGRSDNLLQGGGTYGSNALPVDMGSGGGFPGGGNFGGGAGGGVITLIVDGTLTVNGELSADGQIGLNGSGAWRGGGGAGGSLLVRPNVLQGTGTIHANGGNRICCGAGGGGGGRIAIYTCSPLMPLAQITVSGGEGFQSGTNGTIVFGSGTIEFITNPADALYRAGDIIQLTASATTTQNPATITYRWRKRNSLGVFEALIEGQSGRFFNVAASTLTIAGISCDDGGIFDCLATDSCGSAPSEPAAIIVDAPSDWNNDGAIDSNDIIEFFSAWEMGEGDIDLDEDSDSDDILAFFTGFEAGC